MIKLREKIKHGLYSTNIFVHKFPIKPKTDKNRIFLLGTPLFMNYGDQAISLAELQFLKRQFPSKEIISIPEDAVYQQLPVIKKIINSTDVIALHGGGNMNDIYPLQDEQRIAVIKEFTDNRIVLFPQSTSYDLSNSSSSFFELKENIENRNNVYLFFRDQYSMSFMKNNIQLKNIFCVPDIVLSLRVNSDMVDRQNKITTFLRRDVEKVVNENLVNLVKKVNKEYNVEKSDTADTFWMEHVVTKWNHEKLVKKKLLEFQSAKLIITDRLHGMIFSIITGTPAIVFDNSNHKIKNAYESWFKDIPYIYYVEDTDNIKNVYSKIDELMNGRTQTYTMPDFSSYYAELIRALSRTS
ncbi:polysaccharide pyruvyl transferase family protein [Limosilactobacillus reuteri]|uniref:polysaccharide pyruvyl transferase family protein n=1 Tax=Limosilactobacillus reuteri TaxID=1598 RepID=UPI003990FC17